MKLKLNRIFKEYFVGKLIGSWLRARTDEGNYLIYVNSRKKENFSQLCTKSLFVLKLPTSVKEGAIYLENNTLSKKQIFKRKKRIRCSFLENFGRLF